MEKSQPNNHALNQLKQLNKASHKISKPTTTIIRRNNNPNPPLNQEEEIQSQNPNQSSSQQNQPPVYNINKSDFRQVVQKLTGSPAHTTQSPSPSPSPSPINHTPKPQSSRLQRIRPPPLAHLNTINHRPPQPANPSFFSNNNGRSIAPLSPLPPFPSVHAAAESPISAYMKYLRGSISPKWLNPTTNNMMLPPQQQQFGLPSPSSFMGSSSQFGLLPNFPIAFGKIQSPRSPYPLLSPSSLFSPTSGQLRFPQFH